MEANTGNDDRKPSQALLDKIRGMEVRQQRKERDREREREREL